MNKEKFYKLLEQIRTNEFTDNTLEIIGEFDNGETYEVELDDDLIMLLSQALKHNTYIKTVNLMGQKCGNIGAVALAEVANLEELNLWYNSIRVTGATALARSNLKTLILKENNLYIDEQNDFKMMYQMIEAFIDNRIITKLNLYGSGIPNKLIAYLIDKNTTIKELILDRCHLSDKAFRYIANNHVLEKLSISGNHITDKAVVYISRNTSLKELIVDKSFITDKGAKILSFYSSLKKLQIRDSDIGISIEGLKYFVHGNLDEIDISYKKQHISDDLMFQFHQTFNQIREERAKKNIINENNTDVIENTDDASLTGNADNTDDCI